jgi:hypothetical protein
MQDRAQFERLQREQAARRMQGLENHGKTARRREIELAKERGEHIAALQLKRDMLEKDRVRILEDLERVKQGDIQ